MQRWAAGSAAVLAIALASCQAGEVTSQSPEGTEPGDGDQVVNIYSARHYNTDDALYEGFTEQTGIEVNVIEGKDSELLERLKSEGANSPADVFLTVDAGRLWRAEQENLFQPVTSEALETNIPANLRHPDGLWYGLSQRARIFVYDPEKVNLEEMSTYEDLADPKWQGRICIRSSGNIYNLSLMSALIEKNGPDTMETWTQSFAQNLAREPEGGDIPQIQGVADGSCELAVVNHYYLARMLKSEDPQERAAAEKVRAFFPADTHVNISGAGVLVNAPNKDNAVMFLDYMASPEAQEFFAQQNNEYPAMEGIALDPVLDNFGDFTPSTINVVSYGKHSAEAIEMMDRAGWK